MMMESHRLRKLSVRDLAMVLEWRNRKEVRKNSYTSHIINEVEHSDWFEKLSSDDTRQCFIFESEEEPRGVVTFTKIDNVSRTADWAFYSGNTKIRGIGTSMEIAALNYAFDNLKLRKLSCEVLGSNDRVIRFHRKFGFEIEGVFRSHHFKDEKFHDIYRLAITSKNWIEKMRPIVCGTPKQNRHHVGQHISQKYLITKESIVTFADASGDQNKIHLSKKAAIEAGFEREVAHGAYLGALISKIIGVDFPGQGTIYLSQKLRFLKPVYINTVVHIEFVVLSIIEKKMILETIAKDDDGKLLAIGEAEVLLSL